MVNFLKTGVLLTCLLTIFGILNPAKGKDSEYVKVGNDSIPIVNSMMSYHLSFIKNDIDFENITFQSYAHGGLQNIYDSLSKLYLPFEYKKILQSSDVKKVYSVVEIEFTFLIDSAETYTLWVFIPDNGLVYNRKRPDELMKKLFKLNNFGILAFKNSKYLNNLKDQLQEYPKYLDNNQFYKEYLKLLKKLPKK